MSPPGRAHTASVGSPTPEDRASAATTDPKPAGTTRIIRGQVLDPEGKPSPGVSIVWTVATSELDPKRPLQRLATSGPDGRFDAAIPTDPPGQSTDASAGLLSDPVIAAFAPKLGPDWIALKAIKGDRPISLRLRRDDVAVDGQITGLEGQPIPNLDVRLLSIAEFPAELFKKLRENNGMMNPLLWGEMRNAVTLGEDSTRLGQRHRSGRPIPSQRSWTRPGRVTRHPRGFDRKHFRHGCHLDRSRVCSRSHAGRPVGRGTQSLRTSLPHNGRAGRRHRRRGSRFRHRSTPGGRQNVFVVDCLHDH